MNQYKAYLYSIKEEDCASDKWDYGLLKEIFNKNNIEQIKVTELPEKDKAFIVIPGPQNIGYEEIICEQLKKIKRVILFLTGDESATFNIEKIKHSNIEIWIQYPHKHHAKYHKLPIGVPQHLSKNLPSYQDKSYDTFFAGQITHQRRKELAKVMPSIPNSIYEPTKGFAQGLKPKIYYDKMFTSKIVPCPSGQEVIDSFRFFESIEMLCLPIADGIDSKGTPMNYYGFIFDKEIPVTILEDWQMLPNVLPKLFNDYPHNMHNLVCWWIKYKRDLSIKIMGQINA
jgi:hypothetical protein